MLADRDFAAVELLRALDALKWDGRDSHKRLRLRPVGRALALAVWLCPRASGVEGVARLCATGVVTGKMLPVPCYRVRGTGLSRSLGSRPRSGHRRYRLIRCPAKICIYLVKTGISQFLSPGIAVVWMFIARNPVPNSPATRSFDNSNKAVRILFRTFGDCFSRNLWA